MPPFDVSPTAPHELLPACRLLFSDGRAEYSRDRITSEADTSRLFVARAGGKLRAAALVQALPGALGVAWVPRGHSADALDAVTAAAVAWLRERGVKVCQAFAAAGEAADMAPLERAGFTHTTQLLFLRREIDRPRDEPLWEPFVGPLVFHPHAPETAQAFAQTLVATHAASLDCPELNVPRTTQDVLDGFREPNPLPKKWLRTLVTAEGLWTAAGVVALDDSSDPAAREIAYLGIIPTFRGRGYGDWLLRFAISVAAAHDETALTVSVDARNAPAMHLYTRRGFVEYDRREVWLLTQAR